MERVGHTQEVGADEGLQDVGEIEHPPAFPESQHTTDSQLGFTIHHHHTSPLQQEEEKKKREEEWKHVPLGSLHLGLRQLVRGALFVVEDQRLLGLIEVGPVLNAARPPHHLFPAPTVSEESNNSNYLYKNECYNSNYLKINNK